MRRRAATMFTRRWLRLLLVHSFSSGFSLHSNKTRVLSVYEEKSLVLSGSVSVHEERVLVCRLLLDVIMKAAFGVESNVQVKPDPVFVKKARSVFQTPLWVRFFSMFPFWEYFSRFVSPLQNVDYFSAVQKEVLDRRRQQGFSGNRDLVQLMLEAHEENIDGVSRLSDDEVTAQSVAFLVAGY